ncbi:MAG: hypothetical protein ACJ74O_00080, partial [Frankiaceae bacterium]
MDEDRTGPGRPTGRALPSRRQLLAGAAVALLAAGCRDHGRSATPGRSRTAEPVDPATLRALDAARADEDGLIAAYDAVLARWPALAAALRPVRDEHAGHR